MTTASAPARSGPKLCTVCAYRLDPVVEEGGVHPLCAVGPQEVPKWRREIAAWLARRAKRTGDQR